MLYNDFIKVKNKLRKLTEKFTGSRILILHSYSLDNTVTDKLVFSLYTKGKPFNEAACLKGELADLCISAEITVEEAQKVLKSIEDYLKKD